MSTSQERWLEDKHKYNWKMPPAPPWMRLPIARHIRSVALMWNFHKHSEIMEALGWFKNDYDDWVLYGMWRGWG